MSDDNKNLPPSSSGDVLREFERQHAKRCPRGKRIDQRCPCGLTTVSSCSQCKRPLTVWQLIEGVHCEHFEQARRWIESTGSSLR